MLAGDRNGYRFTRLVECTGNQVVHRSDRAVFPEFMFTGGRPVTTTVPRLKLEHDRDCSSHV